MTVCLRLFLAPSELAVYSAVSEPFNDLLHRCEGHWRRGGTAMVEGFTRRTIKDADKVLQWLEDRGVLDKVSNTGSLAFAVAILTPYDPPHAGVASHQ